MTNESLYVDPGCEFSPCCTVLQSMYVVNTKAGEDDLHFVPGRFVAPRQSFETNQLLFTSYTLLSTTTTIA